MNRLTQTLAVVYLALLPIAWPVLPGDARVTDLLIPILALLVLGRAEWRLPTLTWLDWTVVAYLATSLPSLAATDDYKASALELLKQAYLALVYAVFAIYFRQEGVATSLRLIARAAAVLSVAGLAAVALYYTTGTYSVALGIPWPLPYIGRVLRLWVGTESSEMFGNYLTFALPLACGLALAAPRLTPASISSLAVTTAAMALTFSHAVGGFAAAGLLGAWSWMTRHIWAPVRSLAVITVIVLIVVMNLMLVITVRKLGWAWDVDGSVPPPDYYYVMQGDNGADRWTLAVSYNPMSYYLIKRIAVRTFLDHPWTGIGVGRFHVATERAYQEGRIHRPYRAIDPHSTLLGALAERGIAGGLAVIALLATALMTRRAPTSRVEAWVVPALHAAVVGLIVNSVNADIMNFRFLWVGLAALRAAA